MKVFEIHITGSNDSILKVGEDYGVKTIAVDLLKPDGSYLRTEFMTSHIVKFPNYAPAKAMTDRIAQYLVDSGVRVTRVKIESPFYPEYQLRSLYIESHFELGEKAEVPTPYKFPTSRNVRKTELLGTDREYQLHKYEEFRERNAGNDIELCLYDSYIKEDADWFAFYS